MARHENSAGRQRSKHSGILHQFSSFLTTWKRIERDIMVKLRLFSPHCSLRLPTFVLLTTIVKTFYAVKLLLNGIPRVFSLLRDSMNAGHDFFRCRASRSTKLIPTEMPESVIKSFHQTKITVINVARSIRKIWFRFLASVIITHNSHHPKKQRVIVLALHCLQLSLRY